MSRLSDNAKHALTGDEDCIVDLKNVENRFWKRGEKDAGVLLHTCIERVCDPSLVDRVGFWRDHRPPTHHVVAGKNPSYLDSLYRGLVLQLLWLPCSFALMMCLPLAKLLVAVRDVVFYLLLWLITEAGLIILSVFGYACPAGKTCDTNKTSSRKDEEQA